MKLSIVIVNYNVRNFLEQCLRSVIRASEEIDNEIFVVDNQSVDGSQAMIKDKFPLVKLIENDQNLGFSKANNQALRRASGEFILVLNPDTLVDEDTFKKCIAFMEAHPVAGALGVKMIDGKGKFLPESKRSLPTPAVAFYKIFGLSALFPKSKTFGKYHLSYLDKNITHQVEILSGAFMFFRKEALNKAGFFDERFFMYGEDIDLSYRILKEGYINYYYPETTIIHYKGESTKKSSINYVLTFYQAMLIFASKHFSRQNISALSFMIKIAVYFRAILSATKRTFRIVFLPLADLVLLLSGYYLITPVWENIRFSGEYSYPSLFINYIVPAYIAFWLVALFFSGAYKKQSDFKSVLRGVAIGTVLILLVYSLLPESLRFSRALILLGSVLALSVTTVSRLVATLFNISEFHIFNKPQKRVVIVASPEEYKRIKVFLRNIKPQSILIGNISEKNNYEHHDFLGTIDKVKEIADINRVDEVIFSSRDISSRCIIATMLNLTSRNILFRIVSSFSESVNESSTEFFDSEIFNVTLNPVNSHLNQFKKRIFDLFVSAILLLLFPVLMIIIKKPNGLLLNIFRVFSGKISWVGPVCQTEASTVNSYGIKNGAFSPEFLSVNRNGNIENEDKLILTYARNYLIWNDLIIVLKGIKSGFY